MKKGLFLLVLNFFFLSSLFSQVVMVQDGFTSRCNYFFYDPGGPNNNHGNNKDLKHTLCSTDGSRLLIEFHEFDLGTGDYLFVYNGTEAVMTNLISMYSSTNQPTAILSTDDCVTFRFISNASNQGSGWKAFVNCFDCVEKSTIAGSPCSDDTPLTPFCTDEENPFGTTTYPSTYGQTFPGTAAFFNGSTSAGCLYTFPNPAWYFMRVSQDGDFIFDIEQRDLNGNLAGIDVDFACWGPFYAATVGDLQSLICCGYYSLFYSRNPSNAWETDPLSNMVDCSYSSDDVETCVINDAIAGEWYILLLTNYENAPGIISFELNNNSSGTMDCEITAAFVAAPTCEGGELVLTISDSSPGDVYEYTGENGFSLITDQSVYVVPNADLSMNGLCTLTVYKEGIVHSTYLNSIIVNPLPVLTIDTTGVLCYDMPFTISANDTMDVGLTTSFQWKSHLFDTNEKEFTFNLSDSVTFYLNAISNSGCEADTFIKIIPDQRPTIVFSPPTVCSGMDVTAFSNQEEIEFHWSTGETTQTIAPFVENTQPVHVTVTTPNGCWNADKVTVYPMPIAGFKIEGLPFEIEDGEKPIYFVDRSYYSDSYEWNFGDLESPFNTSTESSPSHTYTTHGKYTITQTVKSEDPRCIDTHSETIEIEQPFYFYIPNSFTPNGDGLNDEFMIIGDEFSEENYSMLIFERNGTLVFRSESPYIGWNGKNLNGEECNQGVYICIVRVSTITGKHKELIQSVTLYK